MNEYTITNYTTTIYQKFTVSVMGKIPHVYAVAIDKQTTQFCEN